MPNDPFGPALILSHSPPAVTGHIQDATLHHVPEQSNVRPEMPDMYLHQQSGTRSATESLRLGDQPSVELLGSELYEDDMAQHC